MMRRLLPFPVLTVGLLVFWLLLNRSLSLGHLVLGVGLAVTGGLIFKALQPGTMRLRRPSAIAELGWLVLQDIVHSNIAVARIIIGGRLRSAASDFVEIPLELRAQAGLAALAIIITSTPGTVWVDYDPSSGVLTIHVLDLVDRAGWVRTIKDRYERRLMEIFE
jgi:multicomponent K+:H+ antiporter subunit E